MRSSTEYSWRPGVRLSRSWSHPSPSSFCQQLLGSQPSHPQGTYNLHKSFSRSEIYKMFRSGQLPIAIYLAPVVLLTFIGGLCVIFWMASSRRRRIEAEIASWNKAEGAARGLHLALGGEGGAAPDQFWLSWRMRRPRTMKLRVSSANFTLEGGSLQIVENDSLVWLHYIYNTSYFVPT